MGKRLYVGNLPYSANDAALLDVFTQVGKVESARVITDKDSGRSKGFGFVEMATDEEAVTAIAKLNGASYEGRAISVAEAKPVAPRDAGRGPGDKPDAKPAE